MNDAPTVCPACGVAPAPSHLLAPGIQLLRCPVCQMGWWRWPAFDPAEFYDRDYFQSDEAPKGYNDYASLEAGVRRTARTRLGRLEKLLSRESGRRLLDLGCGPGTFVSEAVASGWEASGVEVSPYAAAEAQRHSLNVRCGPLETFEHTGAAFDCVTLWDVIEHVRDPLATLRRAAGALRPGGVLALSTGDVTSLCARLSGRRWRLYNLPEHLFFFSPLSLKKMLDQVGCRVELRTNEVIWAPMSYLVERLCKPIGLPSPRPSRRSRWVLPATLFDVFGLYARRVS